MTEKNSSASQNFLEIISGKADLGSANRLVSSLLRLVIKHDDVEKALNKAGFGDGESVANLDNFLYDSALTGSGQRGVEIQITNIRRFRGLLERFLPEKDQGEDNGIKHANRQDGKDRRGKRESDSFTQLD